MPDLRYAQFCPMARAAEIVGERWTLLIIRELLCGPQRFSDLKRRLPGISSSVLTDRLARLEERTIVAQQEAPPPAPASLYVLTEHGEALRPVANELMRFGIRFMAIPQPGDHIEAGWIPLALDAFSQSSASPARRLRVELDDTGHPLRFLVIGGRRGTRVQDDVDGPVDATLALDPLTSLGLATGLLPVDDAMRDGRLRVDGDAEAARDFPALFDLASRLARPTHPNPEG